MHIKKTNNTNKLIQISYYSALAKIQKLQNLKKKKRIARNWLVRPVFFSVRNRGVICIGLLTSTVYTGRTSHVPVIPANFGQYRPVLGIPVGTKKNNIKNRKLKSYH